MTPGVLDNLDSLHVSRVHKVMTIRVMGISEGREFPQALDYQHCHFSKDCHQEVKGPRL